MSADSPPTGDLLAALLSRLLSDRFVPNSAQMRQRTSSEREPSTVDDTGHAEQRAWCCASLLYPSSRASARLAGRRRAV